MTKLQDILDTDLLNYHLLNGLVSSKRHTNLPLQILNYTQKAQFDPHWGDGTIDYCRGLIIDLDNNVIARPFKKFHNINTESIPETMECNLPNTSPIVTKKFDGSLGIYWYYDRHEGIATRGSFDSEQAKWATKWYHDHMIIRHGVGYNMKVDWAVGATPLFEIIYPENRIVVNYDFDGLVLLGMVDNEKGFEWDYRSLHDTGMFNNFQVAPEICGLSLLQLKEANIPNEEGYVLTYLRRDGPPLKVKVKMADYIRLHKIVTGMNPRSVWELLSTGKDFTSFDNTPESFQKWLRSWITELYGQYDKIWSACVVVYGARPPEFDETPEKEYRKQFAQYVQDHADRGLHGILFAMLDGKDPNSMIWKSIKPRGDDQTFRTEGE